MRLGPPVTVRERHDDVFVGCDNKREDQPPSLTALRADGRGSPPSALLVEQDQRHRPTPSAREKRDRFRAATMAAGQVTTPSRAPFLRARGRMRTRGLSRGWRRRGRKARRGGDRPVTAASAANSVCTRWGTTHNGRTTQGQQAETSQSRHARSLLTARPMGESEADQPLVPTRRSGCHRSPMHVRLLLLDTALDCACCVSKHVFLFSFLFCTRSAELDSAAVWFCVGFTFLFRLWLELRRAAPRFVNVDTPTSVPPSRYRSYMYATKGFTRQ